MRQPRAIPNQVMLVIIVSTLVRLVLASVLELGNDEVYYWTYALYPDASHFDHPPMVGFLIQASTFNLFFTNDFFLRLGPIVLAALSTWIVFLIGTKAKNETAGFYAALLFTSSFYCSLIAGFAIIPDAPQVFFWLLCLYFMIDFLPAKNISRFHRFRFLLFGFFAGMAMLSKYHSAFLWIGAGSYILFFNRRWLTDYTFYAAIFISMLIVSPVLYWSIQNNFISFTFHANRVTSAFQLRPDYFLRELGGQILYNNPVNYVLIIVSLVALVQKKLKVNPYIRILLLTSLPLYVTFTGFSLFRSTLPHWTGPSFISLIIIAAIYWSERLVSKEKIRIPRYILSSIYLWVVAVGAAVYAINYSPFTFGETSNASNFGSGDFTQDMYGWEFIGKEFKLIALREELANRIQRDADIISYRWFPGAHEDFYVASPMHRNVYLIGDITDIHKYYWINKYRKGLTQGKDYYHIALSNYYRDPNALFGNMFEKIVPLDTIDIRRGDMIMRYAFVYKLENYIGAP